MSLKIILKSEIEEKICEMSKFHSQKEIGIKYGYSQSFICSILKKNKINVGSKSRLNNFKLKVDETFFEVVDTPQKAYWLGYLGADGNIHKNLCKCTLVSKDLEIIERFKRDIMSDHKISKIVREDKRTGYVSTGYTIQVTNRIFVKNILKYGITPQKSEIFTIPIINETLYPYFFAGLFDGDGYIGMRRNDKVRISLIGTKEILIFLQNYLINNFLISSTKLQRVADNRNVWKLLLYKDAVIFLNWIYSDKNFNYLSRKYEKYISLVR